MKNKKNIVHIAFVGLGERGLKALRQLASFPEVRVAALCDTSAERLQTALTAAMAEGLGATPTCTHH